MPYFDDKGNSRLFIDPLGVVELIQKKKDKLVFYGWCRNEWDALIVNAHALSNKRLLRLNEIPREVMLLHHPRVEGWFGTIPRILQEEANQRTASLVPKGIRRDDLVKAYFTACQEFNTENPTYSQLEMLSGVSKTTWSNQMRIIQFTYDLTKMAEKKVNWAKDDDRKDFWLHVQKIVGDLYAKTIRRRDKIRRQKERVFREGEPDNEETDEEI